MNMKPSPTGANQRAKQRADQRAKQRADQRSLARLARLARQRLQGRLGVAVSALRIEHAEPARFTRHG